MFCSNCGQALNPGSSFCAGCGAPTSTGPAAAPQQAPNYAQPQYAPQYGQQYSTGPQRVPAGILGILLGGIGVHKFYCGKIGAGILYILFCWTFIPAFAGFIEGIIYLTQDDATFERNARSGSFF